MESRLFKIGTAIVIPLIGIVIAVTVPEARCFTGIDRTECKSDSVEVKLKGVEFLIKTDGYQSVPEAEIQLISTGAPEVLTTDSNGYTKVSIPTTMEVQVIISKDGFNPKQFTIDLRKESPTTRTIVIKPIPNAKGKSELPGSKAENTIQETALKPVDSKDRNSSKDSSNVEQRVDPKSFMLDYYGKVNDKKIDQAWNMLSTEFQKGEDGQYSYASFQEWWGKKVERVIVQNVEVIDQSVDSSSVKVKLQYIINGKVSDQRNPLFYILRWHLESKSWKLHRE